MEGGRRPDHGDARGGGAPPVRGHGGGVCGALRADLPDRQLPGGEYVPRRNGALPGERLQRGGFPGPGAVGELVAHARPDPRHPRHGAGERCVRAQHLPGGAAGRLRGGHADRVLRDRAQQRLPAGLPDRPGGAAHPQPLGPDGRPAPAPGRRPRAGEARHHHQHLPEPRRGRGRARPPGQLAGRAGRGPGIRRRARAGAPDGARLDGHGWGRIR